jgi:hypothetical protein
MKTICVQTDEMNVELEIQLLSVVSEIPMASSTWPWWDRCKAA